MVNQSDGCLAAVYGYAADYAGCLCPFTDVGQGVSVYNAVVLYFKTSNGVDVVYNPLLCFLDGEYTVKRVEINENKVRLMPANELNQSYTPIEVPYESNFMIWGVVTYVIKKM